MLFYNFKIVNYLVSYIYYVYEYIDFQNCCYFFIDITSEENTETKNYEVVIFLNLTIQIHQNVTLYVPSKKH